ncbi:RNB domain-containing ribonuclease [Solwaraspora sp. WMMA2056]|uniref:RNB domain-containing ribonuclease n=1 Tax=Solwaraspora sp. WMMA2056 TaxID=3015161 RepID=UPI00259BC4D0|nr:RNB domain-containing ribonuclease [Solwaraspora sp. WMMA2056]WJK43587.1 RNB domain-containing ribonuclease [Solwaraspora sp. WMMA2056]
MPLPRLTAPRIDFGALRRELELPTAFPPAAQREADAAAARVPLPDTDLTDVPFVTLDPPGSRDLDQAMCLDRRPGGGFRIRYAIADVTPFVADGGPLHAETWRRGQTIYLPDGTIPLHPASLSEGAASLLPDAVRPAVVWTLDLAADGDLVAARLERARVRSRAQLDYPSAHAALAAGRLADLAAPIALLPEIGELLTARAVARGAVTLPLPDQDVESDGDGWRLVLRPPLPIEEHNAQISLLTGMAAAGIMLEAGTGLLRTMPAPQPAAVARLRAAARALGVWWPPGAAVGDVTAGVDPAQPRGAAFLDHAAELLRGARYTAFAGEPPAETGHGGVGAPYAHVTAPLRRLADRYATEVCLAVTAGREVPTAIVEALPRLPEVMAGTDRTAGAAARAAVDLTEAVLLQHRLGAEFDVAVLDADPGSATRAPRGTVALDEPAVIARCVGAPPVGERVRVRLVTADPASRQVLFRYPADAPAEGPAGAPTEGPAGAPAGTA